MHRYLCYGAIMPKITEFHVCKDKIKKMKVSMCSQVFSHTVSSAINLMAKAEHCDGNIKMPKRAIETAEFFHIDFWRSAVNLISTMYTIDARGKKNIPPSMKNWIFTLKNFILLLAELKLNKQKQAAPRPTEYTTFQLPEDMNTLKPLQESALAYVAGYIIIMEKEIGGALLFRLKYCKKELFQNFVKMYNIIMYILKNHIHSPNLLKSINQTLSVNIKFGFSHCVHYRKLEVILPEKFATLMIFNYVKGINSIIAGRDTRPLPDNASMLYKEAKHIYSKRK
ncbi:hypothetical protein QE152_g25690 [Popillia japonica]|uniref:Uncharacterized protein n=1 Tax=Popillia japonica TaxID=7064 RepID=A0AAW1K0X9_POPJA